ncbi:hypothetical protein Tco_0421390 [Tanacetum coccineum]
MSLFCVTFTFTLHASCIVSYKDDLYKLLRVAASCLRLLFLFLLTLLRRVLGRPLLLLFYPTLTLRLLLYLFALEAEVATVASPAGVLDLTVHPDSESDPSEDPSSSDHALVAPGISYFLFEDDSQSDFESEPLEDPSEEDAPEPYEATIARWRADVLSRSSSSSSSTSAPPVSLLIVPALPGLPRRHAILVLPGQEIPFGRPYRTHPNGVRRMLTARKRVHPFRACIPANCRRSRYVSSSSSPSPRKRRRVSSYSSPSASLSSSASDGSSRKRGRTPTTSLSAATHSSTALLPVRADFLPPRKRLRGSSSAFHQEVSIEAGTEASIKATIEVTAEVAAEPVLPEQTVAERLEEHEIEEEQKALKDRAETTETKRANLHERVRSLKISDLSLRDTLRAEREAFARIERQLGFVTEELRQSRMTHFTDRESLRRMETFLKNMSIGARDAGFGRGIQANEDAQGQLRRNHPFNLFV